MSRLRILLKLALSTVVICGYTYAQPTLTSFTVSPAAANCPAGQCATITSGATVTFSYTFSGSPTASVLEDNYFHSTPMSGGTASINPTSTRYYQALGTNPSGPSYSSTFGKGPGSMFIPVFVGAGTLTPVVHNLAGCALISALWTCPQYGPVVIEVIDPTNPCPNYSQTAGCTGSGLDGNRNPIESVLGRITLVGQTSGRTVVSDAWFCASNHAAPNIAQQLCTSDSDWAFSYRCTTAETINWSGYLGDQSNYGPISGSFLCQPAGGNIVAPLASANSNHLFKTLDGKIQHPTEIVQALYGLDLGNGISDTTAYFGDAGGYPTLGPGGNWTGPQFVWARGGADIVEVPSANNVVQVWAAGCYDNLTFALTIGGIYKCGAGQIYPEMTQVAPSIDGGTPSIASLHEVIRNLNRAGKHVFVSGPLPSCTNNAPPFLLPASNCDVLQDMGRLSAFTHVWKLMLDMWSPFVDAFAIEDNDASAGFAADYYAWLTGFIHQYPNAMVAQGYHWAGSGYGIDLALGPENYYGGATEPALTVPSDMAQDSVTATQLSAIGSGTPVCRSEGGFATSDSDHEANEVFRVKEWMDRFHGNVCSGYWPSVFGVGKPQTSGSESIQGTYWGDQEDDAEAHVRSAWWDMDPGATQLWGTTGTPGKTISTCSKSLFVVGLGSTRDVMIHVSNKTDRTACTGGSLSVTMPAAMLGYWYSTATGAVLGSQVSVGAGAQTLNIPSFGNAFNCARPATSCLPDHVVFRARANVVGQPLISQVMVPNVLVGRSYSATISAQGCSGQCTYTITTGNWPDGLTMTTGGVVSGTAMVPSTRVVGITASDSMGNVSPEQRFWVIVYAPISFQGGASITRFVRSGFLAADFFDSRLRVSINGGVPPISCAAGSNLSNGITFSLDVCAPSPNPTTSIGTQSTTLTAVDALGNTATQSYTEQVISFGAFDDVQAENWAPLSSWSTQLTVGQWAGFCTQLYNPSGAPTVHVTSGSLPGGMSFSTAAVAACGSGTGGTFIILSGTPTTAGSYSFTWDYSDGNGTSPSYPVAMTVENPIQLSAATITETAGAPFIYNLSRSGGSQNPACHVTGGVVPVGVLFDMSTCTFYGTAAAQSTTATVEAIDPWGSAQAQNIMFNIDGSVGSGGAGGNGTISSVSCAPATVVGGASSTCTVTLPASAGAGGASITLTTNSASVTVPATLTIAAGNTTGTFAAPTAPVASVTSATIVATLNGVQKAGTLTVDPADPPITISSVSCAPATVVGGASSTCTVTLSAGAGFGGASISLASNSAAVTVPGTLTIAAGNATGTFAATTTSVTSVTAAAIVAQLNGADPAAILTVDPPASPLTISSVSCAPATVVGGAASTCTVTLSATASSGGASITLTSNSADVTVPATLTIAPAKTTGTFVATTVAVKAAVPVTLTATYNGSSQVASITLTPPAGNSNLPSITFFGCSPFSLTGGNPTVCRINLSTAAPAGGIDIALSSSLSSLTVPAVTVPATVNIPAGVTLGSFEPTTSAVAAAVVVKLTATYNGSSDVFSITLTPAVKPASQLSCAPQDVQAGGTLTCEVQLGTGSASGTELSVSSSHPSLHVPAHIISRPYQSSVSFQAFVDAGAPPQTMTIQAALGSPGTSYSNVAQSEIAVQPSTLPVLNAPGAQNTLLGAKLSFRVTAASGSGHVLAVRAGGLPPGAAFDPATGDFEWTASPAQSGRWETVFTTTDELGRSATAKVPIRAGSGAPEIDYVENAASGSRETACARGSLATVRGAWLANVSASDSTGNATSLAETQVLVNGRTAPLVFVSPTEVTFVCPRSEGSAMAVSVETAMAVSAPATAAVAASAPGIFTTNGSGSGQATATIFEGSRLAMPRNYRYPSQPAQAGDNLSILMTGVAADADPSTLAVRIGGVETHATSVHAVAGAAGVVQVGLTIPEAAPLGDAVPISVRQELPGRGVPESQTATIAIELSR